MSEIIKSWAHGTVLTSFSLIPQTSLWLILSVQGGYMSTKILIA
jgi:hypothetical protein